MAENRSLSCIVPFCRLGVGGLSVFALGLVFAFCLSLFVCPCKFAYAASSPAAILDVSNGGKGVTGKTVHMALVGRSSFVVKGICKGKRYKVKSVTWSSSSPSVVKVSPKGKLRARVSVKKVGSAKVVARLKLKHGKKRTLSFFVRVDQGGWGSSWRVTKKPTCASKGEESLFSLDGWARKKRSLSALGHDWGNFWSTDMRYHWHKCKRCAAVKDKSRHSGASKCRVCSGYYGAANIAKSAVSIATGAQGSSMGSSDFVIGAKASANKKKKSNSPYAKAYNAAHDKDRVVRNRCYPDCGHAVSIAIRMSGVDKKFCTGKVTVGRKKHKLKATVSEIALYLKSREAKKRGWKQVGTYSGGVSRGCSLQPGDVLLYNFKGGTAKGDHLRLYVGYDLVKRKYSDLGAEGSGGLWFYEAGYTTRRYPFLSYSRMDTEKPGDKTVFKVYRCAVK